MTDNLPKITLIATFIIAFITYSFWEIVKEKTGVSIFYGGISLCFVGYTYTIYLLFQRLADNNKKLTNAISIAYVVYLAAFNSLIDELLFDPTKLQLNEYIGFVIIIILTYYNGKQYDRRRKKRNI